MSQRRRRRKKPISRKPNSAESVLLDFEIGLGRAALIDNQDNLEALQILGQALTRAQKHKEALEVDRRIVVLMPKDPLSHYNLACTYSNLKAVERALKELERAMKLGYRDIPHMLHDDDLRHVRRDPRFRKLVEKRWGKRQSRRRKP